MKKKLMLGLLAFALLLTGCGKQEDGTIRITNVSYDPTREFYEAYNQMFEEHYQHMARLWRLSSRMVVPVHRRDPSWRAVMRML